MTFGDPDMPWLMVPSPLIKKRVLSVFTAKLRTQCFISSSAWDSPLLLSFFFLCRRHFNISTRGIQLCITFSKSIPVLSYLFQPQASKESTLCSRHWTRHQWRSLQPLCGELWDIPHFSVWQRNPGDSQCPTAGAGEHFCINSDTDVHVSVHCSSAQTPLSLYWGREVQKWALGNSVKLIWAQHYANAVLFW